MFNKYNRRYDFKISLKIIFFLISLLFLISCSDPDLKKVSNRSQGFIDAWQKGNMEDIYFKYISYRMKEKCELENFININQLELQKWQDNSDFTNWKKDVSVNIDRIQIIKPTDEKEKNKIEKNQKLLGNYRIENHLQAFVSVKWLFNGESLSSKYISYPALYWRFIDRSNESDWYLENFELSEFVPETLDCLIHITPNSTIFGKLPILSDVD